MVSLDRAIGSAEWSAAYGYAEVESVHAQEVVLRCGSDDGIRIWLNGRLVHSHETQRGYSPDSDEVPVHLHAGRNRILVKIVNYTQGWGFGVAVPNPSP
jgi:hypothetical protein